MLFAIGKQIREARKSRKITQADPAKAIGMSRTTIGQKDTAQGYNRVASDTIEGKIFPLLEEKLHGIAQTLGKLDDNGQIAEDPRGQVLGQLSPTTIINWHLASSASVSDAPDRPDDF